ncbi:hypothetical protein LTR60_003366, partial [Cryomyces antarcticus]
MDDDVYSSQRSATWRLGLPGKRTVLRFSLMALSALSVACLISTFLSSLVLHLSAAEQFVGYIPAPSNETSTHYADPALNTSSILSTGSSRIGKVRILFGDHNEVYERALRSHDAHNKFHGYAQFVLREKLLSGLWSKPAYILSTILQEMAKPVDYRLQWLFWFDRDIVIMNPKIPLEIFLPPEPDFSHIHLLVTNDQNGLNNGAFAIKVNDWSVKLLAFILALRKYRPDVELKYSEQSALEYLIQDDRWFKASTMHVPQRWFNAYRDPRGDDGVRSPDRKPSPNYVKEGDLLIHFAGGKVPENKMKRMTEWMDLVDQHLPQWEKELNQTSY